MGIFDYEYLNKEQIKGFNSYKYSCVDTSPLAVYISHPFWNWLVQFYPRTWVPNVLTLVGWGFVMGGFVLESFLDYDITRNSFGTADPIPSWFWLLAAVCTFLGHTLDGTDGKQARRIGASGPTGELFDHGLDSWSTVPFTITIFSIFGHGLYSISGVHLLCVLISTQIVFFTTHWEKYNTGVLYLSWGYDASQFGLMFIYVFTYFVGYEWFQFFVFGKWNIAACMEIGFYACCAGSLVMSLKNVMECKNWKQKKTGWKAAARLSQFTRFFLASVAWATKSPNSIVDVDPRMFFFCMGTVYSNITCRLIIAQMSNTICDIYNLTLLIYLSVIGYSFYQPAHELFVLRISTVAILLLHIHYGVCVVRQLCRNFKIYALDVSYLKNAQK
ncbi:unnamed protein product [Caenorhabditis auriculariae]|uniref:Uncharacterized protein n=1 Tax=Caenorhabditis auriculariae TaxID=2777116 RepID=A0A8S1GPA5_9PELO|nr:unnamed protein product [Caenorhabditis auriculariae]